MSSVVADTHAALWYLRGDPRLSTVARDAMRASVRSGDPIVVASISVVELIYLVENGRLPVGALGVLREALASPSFGLVPAPLDLRVADALPLISREDVPDMPDRVIAAKALALRLPLVTRDGKIRSSGIETIW